MELAGRVGLVTGGGHRVGRALCLALARAGADVVVNYLRSREAAERTAADVAALGRRALPIQADVADSAQVEAMVHRIGADLGRLDIVVNSASSFISTPVLAISDEEWDHVLAVNLRGPFVVTRAAVPLLRRDGGGVIINIADLSAFQPWSGYAHHSVSKAGLVHLTRVLARALAPDVRVNCVAPGTVLPPADMDEDAVRKEREATLLKRLGSPEDVARAVLYLASADWVTGEVMIVDGGRMLR